MGRNNSKKGMVATAVKPSLEEAMQKGMYAAENGKRDEAHAIFRETADLHPDIADVWVWLGGTSNRLDEAEKAFERAYSIDPENEKASLGLRWVRLRRTSSASPISGAAVPVPTYVGGAIEAPRTEIGQPARPMPAMPETGTATIRCANCGTENQASDTVCVRCGQDPHVTQSQAAPQGGAQVYISPAKPRMGMSRNTVTAIVVAALLVLAVLVYWFLLRH